MRTGIANLPLHYGKTPRWLFERMKLLAREIATFIVIEFGCEDFLRKISDPFWFQSFGCALGFDWHSSGLTTTVCGALKEGLKGREKELGLFVAGGKGGRSRKTPDEIDSFSKYLLCNPGNLIYASKITAKVDTSAVQDGYQLYHHNFIWTKDGSWCVIQQGMNPTTRYARRYHWLSEDVNDFVCEPHHAICCDGRGSVLNMVAKESEDAREIMTSLSKERPDKLILELHKLKSLHLPSHHHISLGEINPERIDKIFLKTYERQCEDFETLLGMKGVGPKSIRALSLISELVYGKSPSYKDPAKFSFAHGGKDGYPYPVDRSTYDRTIDTLKCSILETKIGNREKMDAVKRLEKMGY